MPKLTKRWVATELFALGLAALTAWRVSPWAGLAVLVASEAQQVNGYLVGKGR